MEWNRTVLLEGTFKEHQVQLPEHFGTNQKLKHATESILQMPFGHW